MRARFIARSSFQPMQYRHVFHAGNFADVHKHITLLQLIEALKRKDKGFLYLDTHAGAGLYDLAGPDARHSAESLAGHGRLKSAAAGAQQVPPAIRHYLEVIGRTGQGAPDLRTPYAGSPLLAAASLRPADTGIFVESEAPVSRALQRALRHEAVTANLRVIHADGYQELRAQLPPPTRRGLVLIDPPYEAADEERRLRAALQDGLLRFQTGVFAIWYPIKKRHDSDLWLARVLRDVTKPAVAAEFCLHPPEHAAGLNGSGMLVINPPWQFDAEIAQWQPALETLLGAAGGSRVRWLVRETG